MQTCVRIIKTLEKGQVDNMNVNEFQDYIEHYSRISELFYEKVLGHENEKNDERAKAKKKDEAVIKHDVDRMYDKMVDNLYEQIKGVLKKDAYKKRENWIEYFENSDALLDIEDSMAEMEFEE